VSVLSAKPRRDLLRRVVKPVTDLRPSFDQIYMRFASEIAERSECQRLKVGCVITSTDWRSVYSLGYNGGPSGLEHTCNPLNVGECGCLHSESNAVINCHEPRTSPKLIYLTHAPCLMCATGLINLGGVRRVTYRNEYRLRNGLDLLLKAGIEVLSLSES
jgi:dCMP deaminase